MNLRALGGLSVALALTSLACGSSPKPGRGDAGTDAGTLPDAGTPPDAGHATGALTLMLSAPSGVAPAVSLSGPGGYTYALPSGMATQTLTGLEPGAYTVNAERVVSPGPIVSSIYDPGVASLPVTVTAGTTATASVTYGPRKGTGSLWLTDKNANAALAYTPDLLAVTGAPPPSVGIAFPAGSQTYALAFDKDGNAWMTLPSASKIVRFAPSLLGVSGSPTESASINDANAPARLTLDAAGDLWVLDTGNNSIVKYKASDLTGTGLLAISPALTVTYSGFKTLNGLAFDGNGNLWIADSNFNGSPFTGVIREYTPAQLATTGTVLLAPAATFDSSKIKASQGLAVDSHGNLWSANFGATGADPTLIRFDASQLTGSGTISTAPALVVTSTALNSPGAIAFDESGALWVANYAGRTLVPFAASQIVGSGTQNLTPATVLSGPAGNGYTGLAFDPAAAGLPLPR